jgi:hypothetical protein
VIPSWHRGRDTGRPSSRTGCANLTFFIIQAHGRKISKLYKINDNPVPEMRNDEWSSRHFRCHGRL